MINALLYYQTHLAFLKITDGRDFLKDGSVFAQHHPRGGAAIYIY